MRHILFLDNKIQDAEFEQWRVEDQGFWKQYIGVTPTYHVVRTDYSDYPTFIDADGDERPTDKFLRSLNDQAVAKFGEFGFDFLMVMVHQDNWKSDPAGPGGLWGTSYSYSFGNNHLQYCRWDKKNLANVFGTAFHERMHTPDAFVKVELGLNLDAIVEAELEKLFADQPDVLAYLDRYGFRWDRDVVHGAMKPFSYIRWKENVDALKIIAPYWKQALCVRKQKHDDILAKKRKTIIVLANETIRLLRLLLNRKHGVPRF